MEKPFVSILIPVYNGADMVKRCLESVLRLDYPRFDICVLDDRSSDGTPEKIKRDFPEVRVHLNTRRFGFGSSLNQGIKLVNGEVIALVNVDAWVDTEWLKVLVAVLTSNSRIALVGSKIMEPDGKTLQHAGAWVEPSGFTQHFGRGEPDNGQYDTVKECDYVCAAAVAFKRDLFEQVGGFDPRFWPIYFEDVDLAFRLRKKNYQVLYVPHARVWHLENVTWGKGSRKYFYRYHKSRIQFVYQWLLKQNGLWNQLKLEWQVFRKPWPLLVRFCWIGAFFSASLKTLLEEPNHQRAVVSFNHSSESQGDLGYMNQSYDSIMPPREPTWKYWFRRFVGRVIGYYLVRQRNFNARVVRLFNDLQKKIERMEEIENRQKRIEQQLNQISEQLKELHQRQIALLTYLCESLEKSIEEKGK